MSWGITRYQKKIMPSSRGHPEVFSKKISPPKSCALMRTMNINIIQIKKIIENTVLIQTLSFGTQMKALSVLNPMVPLLTISVYEFLKIRTINQK